MAPLNPSREPSKTNWIVSQAPLHELAIAPSPKGSHRRKIVQRLDNVALSLGIVSPQHRLTGRQVELKPVVVAEMAEREVENTHRPSSGDGIEPNYIIVL